MTVDAAPTRAGSQATRVLIVEDHAILTQSLSLGLRLEGMEPHVASRLDERSVLAEARVACGLTSFSSICISAAKATRCR